MVPRKLPSELEEEILVRLPPLSVVRFRAVCKEWNTLFNAKRFANNHFACARPEFLVENDFYVYSISINLNEDPTIKVSNLSLDIPGFQHGNCDGFFFFNDLGDYRGSKVFNPRLRQTISIDAVIEPFYICGIGYDSSKPEKSYKIFGSTYCLNKFQQYYPRFTMFENLTNPSKFINVQKLAEYTKEESFHEKNVSLNGNVYWISYNHETGKSFIRILDFSKEIIKPFCILPCKKKKDDTLTHALAIYKGDRFSLLKQCNLTRKIDIWVTKKKISNGDAVVWINFMTVSIPNFPVYDQYRSSCYLVDNNIFGKTFVMCYKDENTGQARVYVVRGNLCKNIKINVVLRQCSVYVPSFLLL